MEEEKLPELSENTRHSKKWKRKESKKYPYKSKKGIVESDFTKTNI